MTAAGRCQPPLRDRNLSMLASTGLMEISVVVPVYNSAATVPELCRRTRAALVGLGVSYELVLVDDGSRDGSFAALCVAQREDSAIRVIKMLRNFGQHPAITAGLTQARGRWVVIMDDDLQTPPEEIGKLYAKAREGFDIVCGARVRRQDSVGRRLGTSIAQWLMRRVFKDRTQDPGSSFRIISRRVVDSYLCLPETHTYVAALMSWLGFPQTSVPVVHDVSKVRGSRYTYGKLLGIWADMAIGFTDFPLRLAAWSGVVLSIVACLLGFRTLLVYLEADNPVPGYTSLFVSQMFFFGVTLVFMGILGAYVSRIYREVKRRPYFLIDFENSPGVDRLRQPHLPAEFANPAALESLNGAIASPASAPSGAKLEGPGERPE
jgi:glycosyltransferase involved in cell wall biosynthesis